MNFTKYLSIKRQKNSLKNTKAEQVYKVKDKGKADYFIKM